MCTCITLPRCAVLCCAVWRPVGETGKSVSQYAAEWLKTVPIVRSTIKGSRGLSNVLVRDSHLHAAGIASVGLKLSD